MSRLCFEKNKGINKILDRCCPGEHGKHKKATRLLLTNFHVNYYCYLKFFFYCPLAPDSVIKICTSNIRCRHIFSYYWTWTYKINYKQYVYIMRLYIYRYKFISGKLEFNPRNLFTCLFNGKKKLIK